MRVPIGDLHLCALSMELCFAASSRHCGRPPLSSLSLFAICADISGATGEELFVLPLCSATRRLLRHLPELCRSGGQHPAVGSRSRPGYAPGFRSDLCVRAEEAIRCLDYRALFRSGLADAADGGASVFLRSRFHALVCGQIEIDQAFTDSTPGRGSLRACVTRTGNPELSRGRGELRGYFG